MLIILDSILFFPNQNRRFVETSIAFFIYLFFFFKYTSLPFIRFSVNLPNIFIYKFCKTEISIQPLGEPQEHHLGEIRDRQNIIKDKMTGRVNILAHF